MEASELQKKCMLVRLKTHQLSKTITDKSVSSEVRERKNVATSKGGSWKKRLFAEGYEAIQSIFTRLNKMHRRYTVPFDDEGYSMIRASLYHEYREGMDSLIDELSIEVGKFVDSLDDLIEKDREALGDTFDINDYPSPEEVRDRISVEYTFQALPNLNGVEVNAFTISELEKINKDRLDKVMIEAAGKPLEKMKELCEKIAETLGDPGRKFKNSLVGNLKDFILDINNLNITESAEIEAIAKSVGKTITEIEDMDALRKDKEYRSAAGKKVLELIGEIDHVTARKLK